MKPLLKIALLISLSTLAMPGWAGCVSGNCDNGYGVYVTSFGDRYEGNHRNQKMHGEGLIIWSSGNRYKGDWVNNKKHGKGIYVWSDGNRYKGDFVDGAMHGNGVFTWANGDRYEGGYVDGKEHGKGVFTFSDDGSKYAGIWSEGNLVRTTDQDRVYNECLLEKGKEQDMSVSAVLAAVQSVCQSIAVGEK